MSYNKIHLQDLIWWGVHFIKNHQDGVTIEQLCKVQYGVVFMFKKKHLDGVTIEYNYTVPYGGVFKFIKSNRMELQ